MTRSMSRTLILALSLLVLTLTALPATADDWPQFRGPNRDGRSAETGLLDAWPEGGPPLVYRVSGVGNGYSSLSVVGDRIYTTGDADESQYVFALKRGDGSRVWAAKIGPAWQDKYIGARSTPTFADGHLYVVSTEGDVVALVAESGKEVWRRSLAKDFGGALMLAQGSYSWKFAESPLVDGDRVIVTPGAKDAALVALDRKTGKEVWRTKIPALGEAGADGAAYSSVVVSEGAGVRQYVQLLGRGLIGVEARSGRFLWGYNRVANNVANIPTSLIDGDTVFTSSGYGTGAALLRLKKADGGVSAEEVYFLPGDTFQNHHGGMILHEGYVYTGTGHNKGFPLAVEKATGKVAWGPTRTQGKGSSALSYADSHLYFRFQNGLMVLAEATPEEYREKGSFEIPDVHQFSWSHPVISGGNLLLREQDNLYVYDIRKK